MGIFSQWVEVRTQNGGVAYSDFSDEAVEDQAFLGLQQKANDWVYFGIYLIQDRIEEMRPGEKLKLNLEDIKPWCGPIIWADENKDKLVVGPPQKKGGIRSLGSKEIKTGQWKGQLSVDVKALEDITPHILGNSGQRVWLYLGNAHQRSRAINLRNKLRGSNAPQLSPDELEQHADDVKRSFYGDLRNKQTEKVPSLDDLVGPIGDNEPLELLQPNLPSNIPYLQKQPEPTPQIANMFGKSRTLGPEPNQTGMPLGNRIKKLPQQQFTPGPMAGMSPKQMRQFKIRQMAQKPFSPELDVAWSQPLVFGRYWRLVTESVEYPYYPEG